MLNGTLGSDGAAVVLGDDAGSLQFVERDSALRGGAQQSGVGVAATRCVQAHVGHVSAALLACCCARQPLTDTLFACCCCWWW